MGFFRFRTGLIIAALFILAPNLVLAGVVINEIAWMGTLPKEGESAQAAANNEWLEIFNSGQENVLLDGWKIVASDSMPDFTLQGTILAGAYFLLERGNDDVVPGITADIIYPFKNNALSNSGERLFLKNSAGEVVDEVDASSGWQAGDNATKDTMQRKGASWVTASSTPKKANIGAAGIASQASTSTVSTSSPASASGVSFWSVVLKGSIKAYAGEDRTEAVGSLVEFAGNAVGLKNEPLSNARFSWNFGDGEIAEGRAASHIFINPGTYIVGLHVSSAEYAASDYVRITIVPNQISVSGVLSGENGWIRIKNPSDFDVDIGGWMIEDSRGAKFSIPLGTKIGSRAEIALSNKVTQVLQAPLETPFLTGQEGGNLGLTFRYPNGDTTFVWNSAQNVAQKSVPLPESKAETAGLKPQPVLPAVLTASSTSQAGKSDLANVSTAAPLSKFYFLGGAVVLGIIAALAFLFSKKFYVQ